MLIYYLVNRFTSSSAKHTLAKTTSDERSLP